LTVSATHPARIYVKCADIVWDNNKNEPVGTTILKGKGLLNNYIELVPVFYITNNVMINASPRQVDSLARHLLYFLNHLALVNKNFKEIQLDCDWTVKSKDNFFLLINQLHKISKIEISVTIRLHQIKYASITGIPPAQKGVLMLYNLLSVSDTSNANTIFDLATAKKYGQFINNYSLKLDLALPIYNVYIIKDQFNRVEALLQLNDSFFINNCNHIKVLKQDTWEVTSSFFYSKFYYPKGFIINYQGMNFESTYQAATFFKNHYNKTIDNVILFDLNSNAINKYAPNELEKIFDCF
jgi:hypothetical protein